MTAKALEARLFADRGVHALVDGQYGSTGKGALAAWLAYQSTRQNLNFAGAITSAGPNSGHTFYTEEGEKQILKQLPTFAVVACRYGFRTPAFLSAGSVIDLKILTDEAERYPDVPIYVHGCAAVIQPGDSDRERSGSIGAIASTCSGTGIALMRKIERKPDAIFKYYHASSMLPSNVNIYWHLFEPDQHRYFLEVSQGYSLGINSWFYPHVTSRECTVMQGIADARIAPRNVVKTYMSVRTYPIRVGDLDGHSSGDWYDDQVEVKWGDLNLMPELTTVTQRVRRLATFSEGQFIEAMRVNDPDFVFINFLNYLSPAERLDFIAAIYDIRRDEATRKFNVLGGIGPKMEDISFV